MARQSERESLSSVFAEISFHVSKLLISTLIKFAKSTLGKGYNASPRLYLTLDCSSTILIFSGKRKLHRRDVLTFFGVYCVFWSRKKIARLVRCKLVMSTSHTMMCWLDLVVWQAVNVYIHGNSEVRSVFNSQTVNFIHNTTL